MMNRRHALMLPAAAVIGACAGVPVTRTAAAGLNESEDISMERTVSRYAGYGAHFSGSDGDRATTDWLEGELREAGYETRRQTYDVPACDGEEGTLTLADGTIISGPVQMPGRSADLRANLVHWYADAPPPAMAGQLLVYDARFARHSSLLSPEWQRMLKAAREAQAAGIVAITNGPTRLAIRLNAPADTDILPMLTISPVETKNLREAAARGETARLTTPPARPHRPADNLIGRRKGPGPLIIISTPKSGWGICGSERGPGIAIFLALARKLALCLPMADILLVATSGHEYENLGAHKFLENGAPAPVDTSLWVHLGANLSGMDFHDLGATLLPLPSPDPQRFLGVTPGLEDLAREVFVGRAGLEAAYAMSAESAAGELREILAAGYAPAVGAFGAGRFHHTDQDTSDKVDMRELAATGSCYLHMIERIIGLT